MSAAAPHNVSIRIAEPRDVEACVGLAVVAAPSGGGSSDPDRWRDALGRDVEHPDRLLVVAEVDGEIVGYARAHLVEQQPDASDGEARPGYYLIGLWVQPDHRRGGLGAALTEPRLDWIAEHATEAWFFTKAGNVASIELHRRFGFEEVTRRFSFRGTDFEGDSVLFRAGLALRSAR